MPEYEFRGDSQYAAEVLEKEFQGAVVVRITGAEEEIKHTTAAYTSKYPVGAYQTEAWGDARFVCREVSVDKDSKNKIETDIYELLVLRRSAPKPRRFREDPA